MEVLEEEQQGQTEGAGEQEAEGARDLVGGGAMGERLVGTMAIVETPSSIPEVQGTLTHAHCVHLGLSPPARAILICPLSSLPDPPPAPSAEATPAFSRVLRRPLQGAAGSSGYPPCQQPARSSSRSQGPVLGSGQGARLKTTFQAPAPAPSTGGSWQPPVLPQGHTFGSVPAGVTLDCRKLSELHKKSGYRWDQRQHPYASWTPSQVELWEAYCLIQGEGEWATLELTYLGAGDPRLKGQAVSMRWLCPAPSCGKLSANHLDCRGHYQKTHTTSSSSKLCSCGIPFNNASTLSVHLDLKHNVETKWVTYTPPFVAIKYVDRAALPPSSSK